MMKRLLSAALIALLPSLALAQATVIQGGSFTAGHVPQYNSSSGQPTVRDGGTSGGTATPGGNPSTLGITARCSDPPCIAEGAGPNGEDVVIYDGPTGDADGYHYLGFSANIGSKATITTGAAGGASPQGLQFIIDGATYNFPSDFPQIPVEVTEGGTGRTSLTAYNLLVGDGTNDVGLIAPSATSGIPLVSQGSSANPSYGTAVIAGGGTGATTANGALNNLLPAQSGQNGKVLATDGSNAAWTSIPGTGTVTQVSTDATLQGGPITTSGTLGLADAADGSILANISGGVAQPTANTLTAILDDQVGSAQGSLIMRGAATWGALTPGTTGLPLLSAGPGNDLAFGPLSITNLNIAGQTQGDIAYFDGAMWTRLGAGTSGYFLQTQGTGANPQWASAAPLLPGYLYGLTLSNNVTDPTNDIDTAVGRAADNTSGIVMELGSALVKRLDANWAVGTNEGCLDTGSKANSTLYYIYLIQRSDTLVTDELCSTSATSPTMPANYDTKRVIGAIFTDGTGVIRPFYQQGRWFYYKTRVLDANGTAMSNNTPITITATVPPNATGLYSATMLSDNPFSLAFYASAQTQPTGASGDYDMEGIPAPYDNTTRVTVTTDASRQFKSVIHVHVTAVSNLFLRTIGFTLND